MTELTRNRRRKDAIKRRLRRQEEQARKLALLPASQKKRQIRRHKRRGTGQGIIEQISAFDIIPLANHKDKLKVLLLSVSDYACLGYSLAESLKSTGIKAVAATSRYLAYRIKSEQGQEYTQDEMVDLARKAYAIIWMHSRYTALPASVLQGKKCAVFHGGTRYRYKTKKMNLQFNKQVHLSLVQTGELLSRGAKNEHWLLPPVDTINIKPNYTFENDSKLIIGHFTSHLGSIKRRSSKLFVKGSPLIESVVKSLKQDGVGDHFLFRNQGKKFLPWRENLERMARCDIYIESLSHAQAENANRHDWSVQALEACALGCITITNFLFEDRYKREYGEHGLIVANTAKDLRRVLMDLFQKDRDELLELKHKAREWVERLHSYKAIGKRLANILGL